MKVGFRRNDDDSYLPRFDTIELLLGGENFQRRRCIEAMASQHSHAQTAHRVLVFDMEKND
jgi:hypothetical protein